MKNNIRSIRWRTIIVLLLLLTIIVFQAPNSTKLTRNIQTHPSITVQTIGEQRTSTANVLKETIKFAASDLDLDSFVNQKLFPTVGIVRNKQFECKHYPLDLDHKDELQSRWKSYIDKNQGKRACEFIQEVGFIQFFQISYPRIFFVVGTDDGDGDDTANTIHSPDLVPTTYSQEMVQKIHYLELRSFEKVSKNKNLRVFLPMCPYLQSGHKLPKGRDILSKAGEAMVPLLQAEVRPHNIFHVTIHPGLANIPWEQSIRNIRRFQIDATIVASMSDVLVPVGTTTHLSNYSRDKDSDKINLLYGCGMGHSLRYKGWRDGLFEIYTTINKTDVDVSSRRSQEDYDSGFFLSKFCFAIPGDTIATSQVTRSMVAGCVPVFLVADFRELPFSNVLNYSQFSIRMHGDHLLMNDHSNSGNDAYDNDLRVKVASDFYDRLQGMVTSGAYKRLLSNVRIARDFFNYHRFGSRSPYGLAMVSMYQNEIDEQEY